MGRTHVFVHYHLHVVLLETTEEKTKPLKYYETDTMEREKAIF